MLITITIPNWPSYSPRTDRANHSWFRFQNSFFSDQVIFGLTDPQRLLFIFLMCEASRSGKGGQIEIDTLYIAGLRAQPENNIVRDIQILAAKARIDVIWPPSGCQSDTMTQPSLHTTNERTNDTLRDDSKKNGDDFERDVVGAQIAAELAEAQVGLDRARERNQRGVG